VSALGRISVPSHSGRRAAGAAPGQARGLLSSEGLDGLASVDGHGARRSAHISSWLSQDLVVRPHTVCGRPETSGTPPDTVCGRPETSGKSAYGCRSRPETSRESTHRVSRLPGASRKSGCFAIQNSGWSGSPKALHSKRSTAKGSPKALQ
jgi:hypothetical protein